MCQEYLYELEDVSGLTDEPETEEDLIVEDDDAVIEEYLFTDEGRSEVAFEEPESLAADPEQTDPTVMLPVSLAVT